MCWEMDYYWLAEQRKAQEAKAQEAQNKKQRAELLDKLLNEANREADKSGRRAAGKLTPARNVHD